MKVAIDMLGVIYKFTSPSGKSYIGQTIHPHRRYLQHKNNTNKTKFSSAIDKYGFDNFKYEIIVTIDCDDESRLKDRLNWFERYYIRKYDSMNNGYNMTEGGEGTLGYIASDQTKQLLSSQRKNKPKSEAHKLAIKEAELGKPKSSEHIANIKKAIQEKRNGMKGEFNPRYGKPFAHTEETKQKISNSTKGELNPMFGKKHSAESIQKMKNAHKGIHRVYDDDTHTKYHYEKDF